MPRVECELIAAREGATTACSKLLFDALGMSVPIGPIDGGLPSGLQIIGGRYDDATVPSVADACQQLTDWHARLFPCAQEPG